MPLYIIHQDEMRLTPLEKWSLNATQIATAYLIIVYQYIVSNYHCVQMMWTNLGFMKPTVPTQSKQVS